MHAPPWPRPEEKVYPSSSCPAKFSTQPCPALPRKIIVLSRPENISKISRSKSEAKYTLTSKYFGRQNGCYSASKNNFSSKKHKRIKKWLDKTITKSTKHTNFPWKKNLDTDTFQMVHIYFALHQSADFDSCAWTSVMIWTHLIYPRPKLTFSTYNLLNN